ncbi:IPT/TIG domain-containing protein [Spongisporangium articulatum]|uniref:IPT/TIG domain-containing protein n=1 Tax=Spongisporangium articulatum TaxID=3362603 RepID=A0ABW8AHI0_9ACTN
MRKPRITTKRVLGATLAAGLVVAGTVALAGNSSAATVPAMTITPASGSTAGGDTLTIKGKGLTDADGTAVAVSAYYTTAACADGTPSSAAGYSNFTTGLTVVSATKAVLVVPGSLSLAAGAGYVCLGDAAVGSANTIVGSAKYTVGDAPTITKVNGNTEGGGAQAVSTSTFGGTTLTVEGTNFTKKTVVSVAGTAAVTKFVSDTKVTASIPAGAAGSGKAIKVTTEYGGVTSADQTVTYQSVLKASPSFGKASTAVGVELVGKGFSSMTFGAADSNYVIEFVPGGTTRAAADTISAALCTNIVIENDTTLSCRTPSNLSGAYSIQILKRGTTAGSDLAKVATGGVTTVISRSATYTAANF